MKRAFARADGTRIEGKRVIVDAERGRTTPNWRPMRLGGGLGGYTKQLSKKEIRMKAMGNQSRRGGGGGGGGSGGFRGGPGGPGGGGGGGGGRGGRAGFGDDRTCHVCGQNRSFRARVPGQKRDEPRQRKIRWWWWWWSWRRRYERQRRPPSSSVERRSRRYWVFRRPRRYSPNEVRSGAGAEVWHRHDYGRRSRQRRR